MKYIIPILFILLCLSAYALDGDANNDNIVDLRDLILVAQNFESTNFDARANLNGDNKVDLLDLIIVAKNYGNAYTGPVCGDNTCDAEESCFSCALDCGDCPPVEQSKEWYMVAANPERTSWVSEEVSGSADVKWYRPIEAYIGAKVQLIAANNMIYVSTARGLYALDADTGDTKWRYDTEMPLGHSPTVIGSTLYVGGFDKKVHAIDAHNGQRKWVFEGSLAGFDTNPVVVNNRVYIGGRDGYFYALDASNGNLIWKYPQGDPIGPIMFSAAYKDNILYFAANDNYAYALNAASGSLIWKKKLGGHSYQGFWPVIYQDKVIFASDPGYRIGKPGTQTICCNSYYGGSCEEFTNCIERDEFSGTLGSTSTNGGTTGYASGVTAMNMQKVVDYFKNKPWRKSTYILNRNDGSEYSYPVPALNWATKNGNVYPPIVNPNNGLLYIQAWYKEKHISRGQVMGWKLGNSWMTMDGGGESAVDEPQAISGGGNIIYRSLCCDRQGTAKNVQTGSEYKYWGYRGDWSSLEGDIPGYDDMWVWVSRDHSNLNGYYGGAGSSRNGIYGSHGYQAPIIPYKGKLYVHRSNSIIAYSSGGGKQKKSLLTINKVTDNVKLPSNDELVKRLEYEVKKIVDAGQLRTGYHNDGYTYGGDRYMYDYYAIPGETLYTLSDAYFLIQDAGLKSQLKVYLLDYYNTYFGNTMYTNLGWQGPQREAMEIPPEIANDMASRGKSSSGTYPPQNIYAMWKFALVYPEKASEIYNKAKSKLQMSPSTDSSKVWEYHSAMQGYIGYLKLYDMAGASDSSTKSQVESKLNSLYSNRASVFSKDSPWRGDLNKRQMGVSRNFIYLVPEIGDALNTRINSQVKSAIDEYNYVTPYWMATAYEASSGEKAIQPLYDPLIFQAKAYILKQPKSELFKYLDVPFFIRGDMYYMQNLIATIKA